MHRLILITLLTFALTACVLLPPSKITPNMVQECRFFNGGCFELTISNQEVIPLPTPRRKAIYKNTDYYVHAGTDHIWYVPEAVPAVPKFVVHSNEKTAGKMQGRLCRDVIIEQANALTFRARRFNLSGLNQDCNRRTNVFVEGREIGTDDHSELRQALPPGDYIAFVRVYGELKGWDKKTVFFTVGQ